VQSGHFHYLETRCIFCYQRGYVVLHNSIILRANSGLDIIGRLLYVFVSLETEAAPSEEGPDTQCAMSESSLCGRTSASSPCRYTRRYTNRVHARLVVTIVICQWSI